MIVDDSRIDNLISRKVLEREQIAANILVYANGAEALGHLRKIDAGQITDALLIPSVIFVDILMPEMSGRQFLDEFGTLSENLKRTIKIILFSGSILNAEQRHTLESNPSVLKCISKPLQKKNVDELVTLLRENPAV
jgi:CheY-like chemotaxis protein